MEFIQVVDELISSVANLPGVKINDNLGLFNALVLTDLARRCLNKSGKRKLGKRTLITPLFTHW